MNYGRWLLAMAIPFIMGATPAISVGGLCSIQRPVSCRNSNDLYWSKGFAVTVKKIVASSTPTSRGVGTGSKVPSAEIVDDIGNLPNGVDRLGRYSIFYGAAKGNSTFQGAIAISSTGRVIGISVFRPCDAKQTFCSADGYMAQTYIYDGPLKEAIQKRLASWISKGVNESYRTFKAGSDGANVAHTASVSTTTFRIR